MDGGDTEQGLGSGPAFVVWGFSAAILPAIRFWSGSISAARAFNGLENSGVPPTPLHIYIPSFAGAKT